MRIDAANWIPPFSYKTASIGLHPVYSVFIIYITEKLQQHLKDELMIFLDLILLLYRVLISVQTGMLCLDPFNKL